MRFATENRHLPGVPWLGGTVRNTRIVRRKRQAYFCLRVVSQLDRLASRQQLYVDFSRCEEGIVCSNECKHSSIRGESGIHRRVREERQLFPLFAGRDTARGRASEKKCGHNRQKKNSGRNIKVRSPHLRFFWLLLFCLLFFQ